VLSGNPMSSPKTSPLSSPKTPKPRDRGGRPVKRTDRWYALLALIYVTADELTRTFIDTGDWGWWYREMTERAKGQRRGRTSGRTITANLLSLRPNTVSNALGDAAERGLFTRQRYSDRFPKLVASRARNRPGGRLTEDGWKALGAAPDAWRQEFGPSWRIANPIGEVVTGENTHNALLILAEELHAEEQRAQSRRTHTTSVQRANSEPRRPAV